MGWLRGTRYAVRGDNKEIKIKLIQDYCAHKWIQNGAAMLWPGYAGYAVVT